jgi:kynurenine formamidase
MSSLGEFEGLTAEAAIDAAAKKYSNRGKWGPSDHVGTANYVTPEKIRAAAALVRKGVSFALAFPFDATGPQTGQFGRINPLHSMTLTGSDCAHGSVPLPHGVGFADDHIYMPLQCGTQWDALSHAFDRNVMWNGYPCTEVTSFGANKCGVEHLANRLTSRGVLLDLPRAQNLDALPDAYAITEKDLVAAIERQGASSRVGRGDIVIVRTGQLGARRASGWRDFAGGPAPGLSFSTLDWLHRTEIAAVATDTWGVEVKPNEWPGAFQPFHQVAIPHIGLLLGEMWSVDELAADCANDGVYEFLLVAQPLPVTGAVGSPVNPIALK